MTQYHKRVNKRNRPKIERYMRERFNARAKERGDGTISIIDIWDTEFEVENKFKITDYASQKISWAVLNKGYWAS